MRTSAKISYAVAGLLTLVWLAAFFTEGAGGAIHLLPLAALGLVSWNLAKGRGAP
jgi:hypothetical protein